MARFGSFEFDEATRRLRRGGENIHLPPKAFDLLALLVEAAPRVVPKRELHARLWPGGVVADATLVALVKQLRQALGDHDRRAPLIRTVHRVGYALEARPAPRDPAVNPSRECWLLRREQRLPLVEGENVVGRDATAQVRLDDPVVSRRHARIIVTDAGIEIEDLGSKNGTFVGEVRLESGPAKVPDGGRIAFGTLVVTFHQLAVDLPTVTHFGGD